MLSETSFIRVNQNCTWKELNGRVIILQTDVTPPITHELNSTSSFVWSTLQEGEKNFADVLNLMLSEFDVQESTAKEDLLELLNKLSDKKLLWSRE